MWQDQGDVTLAEESSDCVVGRALADVAARMRVDIGKHAKSAAFAELPQRGVADCMKGDGAAFVGVGIEIVVTDEGGHPVGHLFCGVNKNAPLSLRRCPRRRSSRTRRLQSHTVIVIVVCACLDAKVVSRVQEGVDLFEVIDDRVGAVPNRLGCSVAQFGCPFAATRSYGW